MEHQTLDSIIHAGVPNMIVSQSNKQGKRGQHSRERGEPQILFQVMVEYHLVCWGLLGESDLRPIQSQSSMVYLSSTTLGLPNIPHCVKMQHQCCPTCFVCPFLNANLPTECHYFIRTLLRAAMVEGSNKGVNSKVKTR